MAGFSRVSWRTVEGADSGAHWTVYEGPVERLPRRSGYPGFGRDSFWYPRKCCCPWRSSFWTAESSATPAAGTARRGVWRTDSPGGRSSSGTCAAARGPGDPSSLWAGRRWQRATSWDGCWQRRADGSARPRYSASSELFTTCWPFAPGAESSRDEREDRSFAVGAATRRWSRLSWMEPSLEGLAQRHHSCHRRLSREAAVPDS